MKVLKRIFIAIIILIGIAIALVYLYKDTLIRRVVDNYNKHYNIQIDYTDTDLSLFKKFPNADLAINNVTIINKEYKDTLFVAKKMFVAMNLEDLFKKTTEKISIQNLIIKDAKLNMFVNAEGTTNFEIKRNTSSTVNSTAEKATEADQNNEALLIDIKKYAIVNSDIKYSDLKGDLLLDLKGVNHIGNGDFSATKLDLVTDTQIESATLVVGKINYLNKVKIDLDAVLGIDLDNLKFTFKENNAKINALNLVFNGFLSVNDNNQLYDIDFKAPKAEFKSVLSLIPNAYSSSFNGITANGTANVNGFFKGELSDKSFPKYTIKIQSNNASFKYPDLPKAVTNINLDGAVVSNSTQNNPFLDIKNLKFTIDKDTFETKGKITKLTSNPTVDASFKGTLDLENLSKAYPVKIKGLKGVLKADFSTFGDKNSVQNNQFDKIKTNGTASLADFLYEGKDIANPIHIKNAAIKFNTKSILLTDFNATTGKSDLKAKGRLDNLFAFVFDDKKLKGNFDISATNFVISDFLMEEKNNSENKSNSTTENKSNGNLKIPSFLDITTTFKAKKVTYDNIKMENVSGLMRINNQKATLTNTKASLFEGTTIVNGDIDTKPDVAQFDLSMKLNKIDIANSFKTLETFKAIVPIAKAFQGKYNTTFKLKGNLDNTFSPELNSVSGDAFAQLFIKDVDKNALPLIAQLNSSLKFIDFTKIDFNKLKTVLSFKNGAVSVAPFEIKYQDIVMHISGSHGFDKSLQYQLKMDIPAKYLGAEAVDLLASLTNINKDTIKIPLSTMIKGTMQKPSVKVDFKNAIKHLGLKVLEYQKEELSNQANDQVNDVIDDLLSNSGIDSILPSSNDTTNTNNPRDLLNNGIKEGVKDVLDGLLGGKKKKK